MKRQKRKLNTSRLDREEGTIIKDWGGRLPIALIYPDSYYIGMSSLGLQAIYRLLNSYSDVVCERVFWEKDDYVSGRPALSLESRRPLSDFSVLAFTVTYELDYFHIAPILRSGAIPVFATQRQEKDPVVIAGGPTITVNPLPLSPFFDGMGIGEAEVILPALLSVLTEAGYTSRDELLQRLARVPGMYVPRHFTGEPVTRQWLKNLDEFPVASAVLTPDTEFGNMYLIEVERGCKWRCNFCLIGNSYSPMRYRSLEVLLAQASEGLKYRRRLGLVGPSVSDHPQLEELLDKVKDTGAGLSISSLRVKPFPAKTLQILAETGAKTVTLAPEAGSGRLYRLMGKGISRGDILSAVNKVAEQKKMKQLKCYFMVGLPSETDDDIREIIDLALSMKSVLDKRQSGMRLSLNIAPFVPKAGTPWQRLPMAPLPVLQSRTALLKKALIPRGIRVKVESPAWSEVQAILARGGAELANVLAEVPKPSLSGWRQALSRYRLDADFYAHQEWPAGKELPWHMIDLRSTATT